MLSDPMAQEVYKRSWASQAGRNVMPHAPIFFPDSLTCSSVFRFLNACYLEKGQDTQILHPVTSKFSALSLYQLGHHVRVEILLALGEMVTQPCQVLQIGSRIK